MCSAATRTAVRTHKLVRRNAGNELAATDGDPVALTKFCELSSTREAAIRLLLATVTKLLPAFTDRHTFMVYIGIRGNALPFGSVSNAKYEVDMI
jgi:hypothetical protein